MINEEYFTPEETVYIDSAGNVYDPKDGGFRDGHQLSAHIPMPLSEAERLGLVKSERKIEPADNRIQPGPRKNRGRPRKHAE